MKTRIITLLSMLVLTIIAASAADKDNIVTRTNPTVEKFTEIRVSDSFVGCIYLIQGEDYSVTIKGEKEDVKKTTAEVRNGSLILHRTGKKYKKNTQQSKSVEVYVTVKELERIQAEGVCNIVAKNKLNLGELNIDITGVVNTELKKLKCNSIAVKMTGVGNFTGNIQCHDAKFNIDGVCNGFLDLQCEKLNVGFRGVGNLVLKGSATQANLQKDGVGHINSKELKTGTRL